VLLKRRVTTIIATDVLRKSRRTTMVTDPLSYSPTMVTASMVTAIMATAIMAVDTRATSEVTRATTVDTTTLAEGMAWVDFLAKDLTVGELGRSAVLTVVEPIHEVDRTAVARSISDAKHFAFNAL